MLIGLSAATPISGVRNFVQATILFVGQTGIQNAAAFIGVSVLTAALTICQRLPGSRWVANRCPAATRPRLHTPS